MNSVQSGGKLISQGAYGCVFYPSLNCDGTTNSRGIKSITKIQELNYAAMNENKINNIIKTIPKYTYYFAPLSIKCNDIYVSQLKDGLFTECDAISKIQNDTKVVTMKGPYIENTMLYDYLKNIKNIEQLAFKTMKVYEHILEAIKKLQSKDIVHFDMKSSNILMDKKREYPIIIDFGLSIVINELPTSFSDVFFVYAPEYYLLPPEIHLFSYLYHEVRPDNVLSNGEIVDRVIQDYKKNNPVLDIISSFVSGYEIKENSKKGTFNIFTEYFTSSTKKYMMKLLEKTNREFPKIIDEWMNTKTPYTWDLYNISFQTIILTYDIYIQTNSIVLKRFIAELMNGIHPDPIKRYNIQDTINNYRSIFKNYVNSGHILKNKNIDKNITKKLEINQLLKKSLAFQNEIHKTFKNIRNTQNKRKIKTKK